MLKSFATLIQVAESRTSDATIKLGQLNARLTESEQKRAVLVNYRDEYRARLDTATMRGAPMGEVRNFRDFLAKLDEAVVQQEAAVVFWRDQIGSAQGRWQTERRSLLSFTTLGARRDLVALNARARQEQKQQDEFAARAGGLRMAFND